MRLIVLVAAIALCGCGQSSDVITQQGSEREVAPAQLPFDNSMGFLDGASLRVPRQGDFLWNGQPVDRNVLNHYLHQYAALPREAGSIFVAFEPGVAQTRAEGVRRQVIDSGLCAQHRCAEVGWDVKRPIVN